MPGLSPFAALRYTPAAGDPARLLAPPYDVIDESEAAELRARSPHNAVHLVLPEGDAPGRYELAARRLADWQARGVLAPDPRPAAYVYRQTFRTADRLTDRRCLFSALRLSPLSAGEVLPHEETHSGPKQDRLALTLACRAQLSPVFLVAGDPEGAFQEAIAAAERRGTEDGGPALDASTPDGVRHRLWVVEGEEASRLCRLGGAEPALIADGHHRYETALAVAVQLPELASAGFVLACLAGERDPGLAVLATHRTLAAAPASGSWPEALASHFALEPQPSASAAALAAVAAGLEDGSMLMVDAASKDVCRLQPRSAALAGSELPAAQRHVATAVFDRLVLRGALGLTADAAARRGILAYLKDPGEAIAAAGTHGAAFLMPPLPVRAIRDAVAGGVRLPAKSTYFAPKIPSGLLLRPL